MGARGRKPKGALSVVAPDQVKRIEPPDDMDTRDAEHFRDIVLRNPADQFKIQDVPLLKSYCEACRLAREAQEEIDLFGLTIPGPKGVPKPNPAINIKVQANANMISLATKLKLCPSCRSGDRVKKSPVVADTTPGRKMFGA